MCVYILSFSYMSFLNLSEKRISLCCDHLNEIPHCPIWQAGSNISLGLRNPGEQCWQRGRARATPQAVWCCDAPVGRLGVTRLCQIAVVILVLILWGHGGSVGFGDLVLLVSTPASFLIFPLLSLPAGGIIFQRLTISTALLEAVLKQDIEYLEKMQYQWMQENLCPQH